MGKNISKNLSSKYSQKLFDHAKQSTTDALKASSKRVIQKTVEGTGDLIGNKIADKITRVSRTSPQNNSETNEEEIIRERYTSPEQRQKDMVAMPPKIPLKKKKKKVGLSQIILENPNFFQFFEKSPKIS